MVNQYEMANILHNYFNTYVPFTWTSDREKGFDTMEDCVDSWVEKAKKDKRVDLKRVFGTTDNKAQSMRNFGRMGKR
jgi:hypothetical protein